MTNRKKSLFTLMALVLVFTLVLGACSSGGNNNASNSNTTPPASNNDTPQTPTPSNDGDGSDEPEKVTLRMTWWGGQVRHDLTNQVIDMYVAENPHVTIEPEFASWDDYWPKLSTQASSNDLPDIIQMDLNYIAQYAERGQLADLYPLINSGVIDTSNIPDSALSGGIVDGGMYGISLGSNALGVAYNPEILEAAGISMPGQDWTYDDLEQLAYDLADQGYFLTGGINAEEFFHYYLRTKGATLYHPDGTRLGYDDDQLFIDYFGWYQRMYDAGAIVPIDRATQITTWEEGVVASGEALTEFAWSNQYVGLAVATQKPLEIHPLPGPNAKQGLFLKPSMFFSVASNSKAQEEAAKFIDYFTNSIEANKVILGERGAPISSAIQEALLPELSEVQANMFEFVSWAGENSSPISPPPPIGAGEVHAVLGETVEAVMYKQISLADAAAHFRSEANSILERNN